MQSKPDDLDAVRAIITALEPFEEKERERIIRWASEKLGIKSVQSSPGLQGGQLLQGESDFIKIPSIGGQQVIKDIKSFLDEKNPTSGNQLVAAVAYYYKFEAPVSERKNSISKDDLMEACRKANRERPKNPNVILVNAKEFGLVDKVGTGAYEVNAVGENLVAVSMPSTGHGNSGTKKSPTRARKIATRTKKAIKKKK